MSTSEAEFEAYFREHYVAVARFLERRLSDRETALELASDVLRLAWSKFGRSTLPERAWLFVTARNLVGNEYRRRDRARALAAKLRDNTPVPAIEPDGGILDLVEPKHREVLRLFYWDDLSTAEIAKLLGCSPNAVAVRLSRARAAAENHLARQEGEK